MLWLWTIHSSGERADCRMSFCNFASGTESLEHRQLDLSARFLWCVSVCGLKAEIADRMETNRARARVRVVVECRVTKTQPRRVDKLLFSSWSKPPTLFTYRQRSLSSVRRVVSRRALFGFSHLIPSVRLTLDHPHCLSLGGSSLAPFTIPLYFPLFLILSSSLFPFSSYYDISQCFNFKRL